MYYNRIPAVLAPARRQRILSEVWRLQSIYSSRLGDIVILVLKALRLAVGDKN